MTDDLDLDLVALVHGELDPDRARELRTRAAVDKDLARQLAALRTADAALLEALDAPASARRTHRSWPTGLLAAAALMVVAAVLALRPPTDTAAAQNELLAIAVKPVGGASHPVLTELAFELQWSPRGEAKSVHVMPLPPGADLASETAVFAALPAVERDRVVPVAIRVVLKSPDGETIPGTVDYRGSPFAAAAKNTAQTIRSHDLGLENGAPAPYVFGRPTADSWEPDFLWTYQNAAKQEASRWFPDQPGVWTIEFHVHAVPPAAPQDWATFAEPLVVITHVDLTGLRSDWGEEVDGMRARFVLATGCKGSAPFALQLRYTGEKPREYNVSGTTITPIPQPLHFALTCRRGNQEIPLAQSERLGVITDSTDLMRAHAPNTTRTILAATDYWKVANPDWVEPAPDAKFALPGDRLAVEFVSQLTAWTGDGSQYWQGTVKTGSVVIP